ncbi:hypothetical protein, partial [Corynebacterium sp. KPL2734]|uniref:hypothetical protein n=1 Tax=Corynebacterium sp. KPL2734 TaxID=3158312 RepID=UPI0032ED6D9D
PGYSSMPMQMNSTEKQSRYLSMNRIITEAWGLVPTRKKLTQPSATHWYLEAGDFHGVAWHFRRPSHRALVLGCFLHGEQA